MLAGFLDACDQFFPDARITCCSPNNIKSQQLRFPKIESLPYDKHNREIAIKNCNVWLGLGDSPFQSDVGLWFLDHLHAELEMCKKYQKKMYFLGVGVNNESSLNQSTSRELLEYASFVWARDAQSADYFCERFDKNKIYAGADLANIVLKRFDFKKVEKNVLAYLLAFEDDILYNVRDIKEI